MNRRKKGTEANLPNKVKSIQASFCCIAWSSLHLYRPSFLLLILCSRRAKLNSMLVRQIHYVPAQTFYIATIQTFQDFNGLWKASQPLIFIRNNVRIQSKQETLIIKSHHNHLLSKHLGKFLLSHLAQHQSRCSQCSGSPGILVPGWHGNHSASSQDTAWDSWGW